MTLSILPKKTKAVLIGMGEFPKDGSLEPIPHVAANIHELAEVMMNQEIVGLHDSDIVRLLDITDNTQIKEELALAAEQAKEALIIYFSGYVISRKGHLYLASSVSSRDKIHLNGISFGEIMSILEEAGAPSKILLLDVCFLDAQEEETNTDAIVESLKSYDSNNDSLFIIAAAPHMNKEAFFGYKETTIFTQALVDVLHQGTPIESDKLTLADICDGIDRYLENMGVNMPCFSSTQVDGKEVVFAHNTRYATYLELRREGDVAFECEDYQEALKTYKKAAELLPANEEVEQKRKFIRLLLKGTAAMGEHEYERAKEAFLKANDLMSTPTVREKITGVYRSIADQQYAAESYERAKDAYKQVLTWDDTNSYAKERYNDCESELQFLDWMEEADRLYFDDKFNEAFGLYEKALTIHADRKAQHRKLECERLIQKEQQLRQQLVEELTGEIKEEVSKAEEAEQVAEREALEQQIEERLRASLTISLTEELRPIIEEMLRPQILQEAKKQAKVELFEDVRREAVAQAKKELATAQEASEEEKKSLLAKAKIDFEEDFWTNCLLSNQIEVYRFYLQFFPRPKYTEKAKARIEDLRKQLEADKLAAEANAKKSIVVESPAVIKNEPKAEEVTPEAQEGVATEAQEMEGNVEEAATAIHKKEEPGDKDAQNILAELEAQFNNEKATDNVSSKADVASEAATEGMFKAIQETAKKSEKTHPPVPPVDKEYSEEELWEKAMEENSLEGYRFYVDNTKDSSHLVDAYYQINQLSKKANEIAEEEKRNEVAQESANGLSNGHHSNGASYHYSINVKPSTAASDEEVEKAVAQEDKGSSMKEDALWKQACTLNTVKAYYEYISQSKDKLYLSEAKEKLQELKASAKQSEGADWEEAVATNTIEAFKDYIRKYPLGDYYAKAMFRISELEAKNN